jgi:ABC-type glutathione transport system ATPase component
MIRPFTHRRSTLLACDHVHVLSRGRVVESGDPDVLIRAGQSVFHRLVTGGGSNSPNAHLPLHSHSMPVPSSSMSNRQWEGGVHARSRLSRQSSQSLDQILDDDSVSACGDRYVDECDISSTNEITTV